MSKQLTPGDLLSLESYAKARPEFRSRVMAHKARRRVQLGVDLTLAFEDRLTMQYQVQEMLRAERIFEEAGIREELEAYNPLIPDGHNWKATMMLEFPDAELRRERLRELIGVEDRVWVRVAGHAPVRAVADEDLPRETDEKTSSVHFLRFDLDAAMIVDLRAGAALAVGVDHPHYHAAVDPVTDETRAALLADLD
jgi:glycerol-3-phosphate dehydrogenase subunit C